MADVVYIVYDHTCGGQSELSLKREHYFGAMICKNQYEMGVPEVQVGPKLDGHREQERGQKKPCKTNER